VVLVARSGLGTLNHTLLSLEALKARSIKVLGLVLNGAPHHANKRTLETITKLPILAELTPLEELSASSLQEVWQNSPIGSD
jgi:dethiobiotin synthetase